MGGKGSGGARVGSGPAPKSASTAFLHGKEGAKARQPVPIEHVDAPDDLPAEQLAVWGELAPHALTCRTLTKATAAAFRDLCEAIVLKRALLAQVEKDGMTYLKHTVDGAGNEHEELKAHPLLAQHRGMMQRVEAGLGRFRLAPVGKEILPAATPDDPFDEFDEGTTH